MWRILGHSNNLQRTAMKNRTFVLITFVLKTRGTLTCCTYRCCPHQGHRGQRESFYWRYLSSAPPTLLILSSHTITLTSVTLFTLCCSVAKVRWKNFPGFELCFLWHRWPWGQSLFICELTASHKPRELRVCIPLRSQICSRNSVRCSKGM